MHCFQPLHRPLPRSRPFGDAWWCLVLAWVLAIPVQAVEPIKTYASVTLKDGRQFSAVEIITYTPNGVLVRHADGVTTFRRGLLSDRILADLHLPAVIFDHGLARGTLDPSLADKPAVFEAPELDLAHRPAVVESTAASTVPGASSPESVAAIPAPVTDAATAPSADQPAEAPAPAGEGNIPEFFVSQTAPVGATANSSQSTIAGRIVVRLPSGEMRLLANVAVKAYPAHLLATFLGKSKARYENEARKLIDQAVAAGGARTGAEAEALILRARELAARYLDDLPEPPHATRSDEYGHFTIRHQLRDARIVAAGQVTGPDGVWNFEWVDVVPSHETVLNEGNATNVTAPATAFPRYTAR
ncbi:MAG: hypothetical protein QG597_4156 [Actinomycetota bacterium]|nr:hypothetical protein [Actinomycetota bacterium]